MLQNQDSSLFLDSPTSRDTLELKTIQGPWREGRHLQGWLRKKAAFHIGYSPSKGKVIREGGVPD